MAGTVKVETPNPRKKACSVSGDTLAAIWKDIEKKGPKMGSKSGHGPAPDSSIP